MASDYGADYYGHYAAAGISYERSPFWLDFFGKIADRLIEDFHPKTALDAGCAIGLLVEALRDRGVDAEGIDFSDFAVGKAREDVRPFLTVGSITEPLQQALRPDHLFRGRRAHAARTTRIARSRTSAPSRTR